jgi:hypothetical protein
MRFSLLLVVGSLMVRAFMRAAFRTGASPQNHKRERSVEYGPPNRSKYQAQDLLSITVLAV